MRISDWSSDVCSSDLLHVIRPQRGGWLRSAVEMRWGAGMAAAAAQRRSLRLLGKWVEVSRRVARQHQIDGQAERRIDRSAERRVGQESVSTCSTRRPPYHIKKTQHNIQKRS